MESPHCKLGPGKCRDCDMSFPPGWSMDNPWGTPQMSTDLQTSHYEQVLQSVLALEKHEIQRIYEFLHKIGHTIYRE
jgi:hypothetical protein